jgi:hypothetical protein
MEKETIEEAVKNIFKSGDSSEKGKILELEIEMLSQQIKRMYSEEDMKLAFEAGHKKGFSGYPNTENWKELSFEDWFINIKNN